MAYGVMRSEPSTQFGKWLDVQMRKNNMSCLEVATKMHTCYTQVSLHRAGKKHPNFSTVLAYCWVFGCKDDPETVWKLADIPIRENYK